MLWKDWLETIGIIKMNRNRFRNIILRFNLYAIALAVILIFSGINVSAATGSESEETVKSARIGYIYTGDSRIRRLNLTINMKGMKDNWVVCKSGMGYNWFVREGLPEIDRIMKEKTYIDKWVIISGWGVNDLWNAGTYINKYTSLMKGKWKDCDLKLMSVNPVNGSKKAKYGGIDSFNVKLKRYTEQSDGRIEYIDTNSVMKKKGFSTIDGLHYSETTNKLIYSTVRQFLDEEYTAVNYEKVTINVNACRTLSLTNYNGKVKWKTDNNNVVKIVQTGGVDRQKVTIQAVSTGKATITAYNKGKTYNCTIEVTDNRIMIAYFTYYGDAERVAEYLQRRVGGDLVWIDRKEVYPYTDSKLESVMKAELENNVRPELDTEVVDITKYDTIYLGYPLWLGYAPRPVCTFLEMYDLTGKTVKPYVINRIVEDEDNPDGQNKTADKEDRENKNNSENREQLKDVSVKELRKIKKEASIEKALVIDSDRVLRKKLRREIRQYFEA